MSFFDRSRFESGRWLRETDIRAGEPGPGDRGHAQSRADRGYDQSGNGDGRTQVGIGRDIQAIVGRSEEIVGGGRREP